jgi:hypothetical protein
VAKRKSFLLRTDPRVLEAIERWARDELRSTNGHVEFLLRRALQAAGRLPGREGSEPDPAGSGGDGPPESG